MLSMPKLKAGVATPRTRTPSEIKSDENRRRWWKLRAHRYKWKSQGTRPAPSEGIGMGYDAVRCKRRHCHRTQEGDHWRQKLKVRICQKILQRTFESRRSRRCLCRYTIALARPSNIPVIVGLKGRDIIKIKLQSTLLSGRQGWRFKCPQIFGLTDPISRIGFLHTLRWHVIVTESVKDPQSDYFRISWSSPQLAC